jgi:hypothetical protein
MHDNYRPATHGGKRISKLQFIEFFSTLLERTPGVAAILAIQQPVVTGQGIALDPPSVKE